MSLFVGYQWEGDMNVLCFIVGGAYTRRSLTSNFSERGLPGEKVENVRRAIASGVRLSTHVLKDQKVRNLGRAANRTNAIA